jgi:outer membrane receptor protein involved in Fe transport
MTLHSQNVAPRRWMVGAALAAMGLAAADLRADEAETAAPADPAASERHDPSTAHLDPHPHEPEEKPAHDHDHAKPIDVTARAERAPTAASSQTITGGELKLRPRLRPADVLGAATGLVVVQHAGGGKANQYFLRGFDIDHGTDLLLSVDGIPINLVSHGHGQGYADLHFIIPELIASLEVHKGPFYAELGDFATAGAVNMRLADHFHESQASFSMGQYGIYRGLGIVSRDIGEDWRFVVAGEAQAQDGPFENPERLRRFNAYARVTHDFSPTSSMALTWMSYAGRWNASGQIPLREVEAGRLDRFGTIDPSEGGASQRHGGSARFKAQFEDADLEVTAYGVRYDWRLYSNFTFFLEDPINGDMIEQTDERWLSGLDARTSFHHHFGPLKLATRFGTQIRYDAIDNALYHDVARERLEPRALGHINQTNVGLYVDERMTFEDVAALRLGVRLDRADASVEDGLDDPATLGNANGGTAGATLVSPKAALTLTPIEQLQLFLDFGRGFHSNDARGAVRAEDPADLLVVATGYEVGTRIIPWEHLAFSVAGFRIDLDSEQVYVGDAGTTEPSGATTRIGVEAGARLDFGRSFFATTEVTLTKGEYVANGGNGGAIALAPTRTVVAGFGGRAEWAELVGTPAGTTFGGVWLRHVGARPATEDGSLEAEGFTVVDLQVGHRFGPFETTLDVQNLLNTEWREVQFATESRLPNEAAPVEEIHFAPGWPLTVRATTTVYF